MKISYDEYKLVYEEDLITIYDQSDEDCERKIVLGYDDIQGIIDCLNLIKYHIEREMRTR